MLKIGNQFGLDNIEIFRCLFERRTSQSNIFLQTAYIAKWFIGGSDRLISDILDVSEKFNVSRYLIAIDSDKAFDSLDHNI